MGWYQRVMERVDNVRGHLRELSRPSTPVLDGLVTAIVQQLPPAPTRSQPSSPEELQREFEQAEAIYSSALAALDMTQYVLAREEATNFLAWLSLPPPPQMWRTHFNELHVNERNEISFTEAYADWQARFLGRMNADIGRASRRARREGWPLAERLAFNARTYTTYRLAERLTATDE